MLSVIGGIGDTFILPLANVGNPPSPSFGQRMLSQSELKLEVKSKFVNLEGQNQMPDDVFVSDRESSLDLTVGRLGLDLINLACGEVIATGNTQPVIDEPFTIPATPFQVTVAGGANFIDDLAVLDAATGQQFQPVASGPIAGQYVPGAVGVGTYLFASADHTSGRKVKISYTKGNVGTGRTLSIANHIQGFGPLVRILSNCPYTCPIATSPFGAINIRSARIGDFGIPFKRNGYVYMPLKAAIFPDGSGVAIDLWQTQAAS